MTFIPTREQIPAALADRRQWVCWRYEAREDGGKPTKMPYQAQRPQWKAASNNPQTWCDLATALRTAEKHQFDGVGYVFSADDPFVGVDLDDVIDERGDLVAWARPWVAELATYAEISPSGKGIKAIAIGKLPGSGINAGDLELYDQERYFTITGQRIDGAPEEPANLNGTIDRLYALARAKKEQREHQLEYQRRQRYAEKALLDEAERVRAAPEGTRNSALNRAAFSLAQLVSGGLLDEDTVADTLFEAAGTAGLGNQEIRATLRSGMKAGINHPRQLPARRGREAVTIDQATGEVTDTSDWWQQGITLADLQVKHFDPLRWIVEQVCPEGVTLVAAKPKSKKSWIALGLGLSIALNRHALGRLNVMPGRVLFLDLEGNQRRIKSRTIAILGHEQTRWPDNFHVFTEWAKGDDCLARLEQWFIAYPDTRMVVIDLLAEIRPPMDPRANQYDYDRLMLVQLNKLAERYGVAIVVIHHTRKAKGEDVFDEVSGTLGINGAVSTLWILSRQPDGHVVLSMTGRDLVQDEPLALRWDGYACSFVIEGSASDVAVSNDRKEILDLMGDEAWTPRQIAADLGKSVNAIQCLLRDMVQAGQIDKTGYGKYSKIPTKRGQSSQSTQSGQSRQSRQSYEMDDSTLSDDANSVSTLSGAADRVGSHTSAPYATETPDSVHSVHDSQEHEFWAGVPAGRLTIVRLFLRSQKPQDQVRARELCEEYGLDYDQAHERARAI
jgi:AAA domain